MDISNLIADFRQLAPEFASSYCIVNGAIMNLDEIQNMVMMSFSSLENQYATTTLSILPK